jgi:hypothetical protein
VRRETFLRRLEVSENNDRREVLCHRSKRLQTRLKITEKHKEEKARRHKHDVIMKVRNLRRKQKQ